MQLPKLDHRRKALAVLITTLVVALGVAIGLTHLFGEIFEQVAEKDGIAAWDRPLLNWSIGARSPALTAFVAWYSNTGGPVWQPIITGLIVLVLAWRWRDPTPVILTLIAVGGSLLITVVGKNYIGRARPPASDAVPPLETSMSYPSGHSLNSIVIAGILAYLLIRHFWDRPAWIRWLIAGLTALYAVTMGLSRVFLGHHWFTDVVGAWTIGLAWLAVVIGCHRVWRVVRSRAKTDAAEEERS